MVKNIFVGIVWLNGGKTLPNNLHERFNLNPIDIINSFTLLLSNLFIQSALMKI